jgi:glycosyltransferase involved in cell wall biosynthesis
MNLLLINHYAGGPAYGMEYRPYYLAREWVRAGHAVTIVAADFSHVRAVQPRAPAGAAPRAWRERLDGIDYRWFATPAYRGNGVGRLRNIAVFMARVWRAARELVADVRPDVVIASSTYPMDIWVARRIARLAGARLVFEVHDLWPLSPIEVSGMSPWHPFIRLCAKAEADAYRDADVVVSMLPKVGDYMASRGLDLRKLHIVPNGVAPEDWALPPQPLRADVAGAIDLLRAQGRAVLGYAGSMGLPNALDVLLDAAALLRNKPVGIVLVGDGTERERLVRRIAAEGLAHVQLLAPIAKAQVPSFLSAVDAAYIGWRRAPIYRFGIAPNKLMDYMMAGCAVLHGVEAGNDPVAESGCGVSVAPESAPAAAAGIERLLRLPAAERRAMGERGRAFVQAHHTWPVLARRFVDALQT